MTSSFADIAFTPSVRAFQTRMGSRRNYAGLDGVQAHGIALTDRESEFIMERDGFYQATVGEGGWPYVQFRGGPPGFLKVLDTKTIGYADFRGNVQYISAGNLQNDGRISLILMDYGQRRRLKVWGRARLVEAEADPALVARLEVPSYRARIERAVLITIEAFDWNCPQHITPRFTQAQFAAASGSQQEQILKPMGWGPLALRVTGVRELTPRIRAYALCAADDSPLPPVKAGAHIDLPAVLGNGQTVTRSYSIASYSPRRDFWEIAVLRKDEGDGASTAVHAQYRVGLRLNTAPPRNNFPLADEGHPILLIAGGIGITPIRGMAYELDAARRDFALHYVGRSRGEMAWADELADRFGSRLFSYYPGSESRLDVDALIRDMPASATAYVCGPARLIDAVHNAAGRYRVADRVRSERFTPSREPGDAPISVHLRRSGRKIEVPPGHTILEAIESIGLTVPSSCRTGTCGTCATKVLEGLPAHRDSILSNAERDRAGLMCICVSRALTTDLSLDL